MKLCSRLLSVLLLTAVVLLGAGCGKAEEKKPAAQTQTVDISTLPEFLRYPGAKATERIALSTSDSKGTVWTLITSDPADQVSDWYRLSAEKAGWSLAPEKPAGQIRLLEWENAEKTETVKITFYPKDGNTAISIAHGLKPDSAR